MGNSGQLQLCSKNLYPKHKKTQKNERKGRRKTKGRKRGEEGGKKARRGSKKERDQDSHLLTVPQITNNLHVIFISKETKVCHLEMWPERKSKDAFPERWLYHRKRTKLFFMCLRQSSDYIGFTIHIQHMSITDLHTQLFTNT